MAWQWIERLTGRNALRRRVDDLSDEIARLRAEIDAMRLAHDPAPGRAETAAAAAKAADALETATAAQREAAVARTEVGVALAQVSRISGEAGAIASDLRALTERTAAIGAMQERLDRSIEAAGKSPEELAILIHKIDRQNAIDHAEFRQTGLALAERLETIRRLGTRDTPQ